MEDVKIGEGKYLITMETSANDDDHNRSVRNFNCRKYCNYLLGSENFNAGSLLVCAGVAYGTLATYALLTSEKVKRESVSYRVGAFTGVILFDCILLFAAGMGLVLITKACRNAIKEGRQSEEETFEV